jgi:putative transposase
VRPRQGLPIRDVPRRLPIVGTLGISLAPAHPHTPTDKPAIERALGSVATLFAQHVAGYVGSSVERRGKDAGQAAAWSMAELQALLDEWIVVWQNRPHDGLRDPLAPGRALTPNERYAALIDLAGYVPVPLGPEDYIELLPAAWRVINSYGVKIGLRTYDSGELNSYRRQHSGIEAGNGRWEVRYGRPLRHLPDLDPQPSPRRLAVRDLETPAHGAGAVR